MVSSWLMLEALEARALSPAFPLEPSSSAFAITTAPDRACRIGAALVEAKVRVHASEAAKPILAY